MPNFPREIFLVLSVTSSIFKDFLGLDFDIFNRKKKIARSKPKILEKIFIQEVKIQMGKPHEHSFVQILFSSQ